MSTAEERKILDDIEKTGYPLEIDVADCLLENKWLIIPQYTYYDEHTGKLRSLDIFATYPMEAGKLVRLILECKTSTGKKAKPWIFFLSTNLRQDIASLQQRRAIYLSDISFIGMTCLSLIQPYIHLEQSQIDTKILEHFQDYIQNIHFFNRNLPIAHCCHVCFKGKKEDAPNDFQKAVNQLRGICLELVSTHYRGPIFATIVFRGNLFELRKTGTQRDLRPIEHIMFYTQHLQPKEYEGDWISSQAPRTIAPIVIDVVKDTYFKEYLSLLKKDLENLGKLYAALEKMKNE